MGIDFTGRGRLRGRALSDGRFTSMLRTVYHHLGDSWKWAHEASDFAASLFYSSISGVSKWFFPQAPSKLSTQTFKPVHNLGSKLTGWRPRRDLNPCYHRERGSGRSAMPCKEPMRTLENTPMLYRPCTASVDTGSLKTGRCGDLENEPARMIWSHTGKMRPTGSARSNSCPLMIERLGCLLRTSSGTRW